MDIGLLATLLITTIVAIIGWFMVHRLSSRREREAKRRDLRVQYLIDAWRRLSYATGPNRLDSSKASDLETAIEDIQLLGSQKQVQLAQKFAHEFAEGGGADLDELLEDLRNDLRQELQLESVSAHIKHLRINTNKD